MFSTWILVFGFVAGIGLAHPAGRGNCPILPSGKCWADCSLPSHEIVCEDTDWHGLHHDLKHYAKEMGNGSLLELVLWNSPQIINIDTNLLHPVLANLDSLALRNLKNLRFFPMLRGASRLTSLIVSHCAKITDFDISFLPAGLKELTIASTNISRLDYDTGSQSQYKFDYLNSFSYDSNQLKLIRGGFFRPFRALTSLVMKNNNVQLEKVDEATFDTVLPILWFQFSGNNFAATTNALNTQFFSSLIKSVKAVNFSVMDLSHNDFVIEQVNSFVPV